MLEKHLASWRVRLYSVKFDKDMNVNALSVTDKILKTYSVQELFKAKERPANKHISMVIHSV